MSKYIVTKAFFDKNTGIGYNPENTFESEDLERVSFLGNQGFIHVPGTEVENHDSNDEPTLKDLKVKAKELGLEGYSNLSKDELVALIESAEKVGDDNAGEN
ncbi:Rho termination factor N-terminal domain-containing protein [Ureibacillus composti]|nr:Rho termination factor N-terminal domain-containing protein [Ureibacillus composti]